MVAATQKIIIGEALPKLCRHCKYFIPESSPLLSGIDKIKYGKCSYQQIIDLVTGHIEYKYASLMRDHICKGKFYKESS